MSPYHITASVCNQDIDKQLARIWSGYARLGLVTLRHLSHSSAGFCALTNYMHSNDVTTENTLNFLNELSVKMAVDTKDDFSWCL